MLEVEKKARLQKKQKSHPQSKDIIVIKYEKNIEYKTDGTKIERRVPKKVNITKMVNERKKVIKTNKAQETLDEIEKIFTNKGV